MRLMVTERGRRGFAATLTGFACADFFPTTRAGGTGQSSFTPTAFAFVKVHEIEYVDFFDHSRSSTSAAAYHSFGFAVRAGLFGLFFTLAGRTTLVAVATSIA